MPLNPSPIVDEIPLREIIIGTTNFKTGCPRKFELTQLYPRVNVETEEYDTDIGTAMHKAYQNFFIHKDRDSAIYQLIKHYPYNAIKPKQDNKTLEACYATLLKLFEHKLSYTHELVYLNLGDEKSNVPGVELEFKIYLKGVNFGTKEKPIRVAFASAIDLLTYNKLTGEYTVVDIKTHRRNLVDMTPLYQFDDQCTPYGIVLEHILGKVVENLETQYLSAYIDLVEPKVKAYPFTKNLVDINDWLLNLRAFINQYEFFFKNNWFPRRGGESCVAFNRLCAFEGVCNVKNRNTVTQMITGGRDNITWEPRQKQADIVLELEVPEYG